MVYKLIPTLNILQLRMDEGAWVAQSVKWLTSVQVTISWFMSLSPVLGSVLTAQSLEPSLDSVSPSLSAPPPFMLCLSKINLKKKRRMDGWMLGHLGSSVG